MDAQIHTRIDAVWVSPILFCYDCKTEYNTPIACKNNFLKSHEGCFHGRVCKDF